MLSIVSSQRLDLAQLRAKRNEKEARKCKCYDSILAKCHRRIQAAADVDSECALFRVPSFQLGMPPIYNLNACIGYLIYNLRQSGVHVDFVYPDTLYMRWDTGLPAPPGPPQPAQVQIQAPGGPRRDLAAIDRTLCRPTRDAKPAYDTDAMECLTRFAQRLKKRS